MNIFTELDLEQIKQSIDKIIKRMWGIYYYNYQELQ